MKKINYYSVLAMLFAVVLFYACSKKEEVKPQDLRAPIEGTYNYKVMFYQKNNGQLVYMGSQFDQLGTITSKKNAADANMIDFLEGGKVSFQANKLTHASNGTTFDVPSQNFKIDGDTYSATKYNGIQLGSSYYHGYYNPTDKKVKAYLKIQDSNIIMAFEATKI